VPIEIDEATPQLSLFRPLEDEPDDDAADEQDEAAPDVERYRP
jgi:hypothetical protein